MYSVNEPHDVMSTDSTLALYRGLKVAVYKVDKTELHLTRNDLIELVNVSHYITLTLSTVYINTNKQAGKQRRRRRRRRTRKTIRSKQESLLACLLVLCTHAGLFLFACLFAACLFVLACFFLLLLMDTSHKINRGRQKKNLRMLNVDFALLTYLLIVS